MRSAIALLSALACTPKSPSPDDSVPAGGDSNLAQQDDSPEDSPADSPIDSEPPDTWLYVRVLGVGGVALRYGEDQLLTAPLFTNPDMLTVTLGETVSDPALVDAFLPVDALRGTSAILVGHAHYDHLLDVPTVAERLGEPVVYGNLSAKNLLAGVTPVAAVDELGLVDRRMCAVPDPCTASPAGEPGAWIAVPGARARVRALCSMHPDQFLGIAHYGEGCVDEPQASPPTNAAEWLEGGTLAWLIDFLDEDGAIAFRVYYQDAPTSAPTGDVHPDLLAERGVDLALLNVGSFEYVRNHPAESLANLDPRYVIGLHWEDFFTTQDQPIEPIPLQPDPAGFDARVAEALPARAEAPALVGGVEDSARYWRPTPQTEFIFPLRAEGSGPIAAPDPAFSATTERSGDGLVLRIGAPMLIADCAGCADLDADGLNDAWEDAALALMRPTLRFDEAEPMMADDIVLFGVGRVTMAEDGDIRVYLMLGYGEDYGRCGVSFHDGDSERVAMNLRWIAGTDGDVELLDLYTAAHEGTVTDHSTRLGAGELGQAVFTDGARGPRWRVFPSDGKHASYPSVDACEDAEWLVCLDEDCDPDGVDTPADFDRLPPVVNAGEPGAPRLDALDAIGFPGEDAWLDQDFCGGQGRGSLCSAPAVEKLTVDPF